MIHHVTRATRIIIFWSLISLAIGSTGLRIVLSEVQSYKAELESKISEILGVPFKMGRLRAKMRGFNPEIVLQEISISEQLEKKPSIQLKQIRLAIDFFEALKRRDLMASTWITLVGVKLTVKRKQDGSFAVVGLKANDEQPLWLTQGGHYEILDSEVLWVDELRRAQTQRLQHVSILLNNIDDDQHQLRMHVNLPEKFGKTLTVMADFSGDIFAAGVFDGRVYAKGKQALFSEILASEVKSDFMLDSGVTDFQIWSEWKDSKLVKIIGDVKIKDGMLSSNRKHTISIDELIAKFRWQGNADQWQLDVSQFKLNSGEKRWPDARFSILRKVDQKLAVAINQLDLEQAAKLVLFAGVLDKQQSSLLKKVKIQGLSKEAVVISDFDGSHFAVNGIFKKVSFTERSKYFRVKNFSGHIKGKDQQGIVQFDTNEAKIALPKIFRKPLLISRMNGQINWQQLEQNWLVSSKDFDLSLPGISTKNRFQVKVDRLEDDVFMDWQVDVVNDINVAVIKQYYPDKLLDKKLLTWLQQLLIAGKISNGKMLFYGKPSDFPFINGKGVFQAGLVAKTMKISYGEQWPNLSGIDGKVLFHNDKIDITVGKGQQSGEKISHLKINLPSWRDDAILTVKAKLEGQIEQTFEFLRNSPLSDKLQPVTQVITAEGKNLLDVHLQLPVANVELTKVNVEAQLQAAKISVLPLALNVDKISGKLIFTEQDIFSQSLKGSALGYPVSFVVSTDQEKMLISGEGKTDTLSLARQFPSELWQFASGDLEYDLQLAVPHDENLPSHLLIQSDLLGLTLDLPEDLTKTAEQKQPLRLDFTFDHSNMMLAALDYVDRLKVAASFEKQKAILYAMDILYGAGEVSFSSKPGYALRVNQKQLNLDQWLSFSEKSGQGKPFLNNINNFDFTVDQLFWKNQDIGRVYLNLEGHEAYLTGVVKTNYFKGGISLPYDGGQDQKIRLQLDEIDLSALNQLFIAQNKDETVLPEDLPLFDLQSETVLWRQHNLGRLNIAERRDEQGMVFPLFELLSDNSHLVAKNSFWKHQEQRNISHFQGEWKVKDLGLFLTSMELSNELIDSQALFKFDLQWPGAPYQLSIDKLAGTVKLHLEDGRLLGIEPGIGRVLGIFNLGNLYRRMRLDFSDVFSQGLSFDDIHGNFIIADGKAATENLLIDALPAKIKISGEIDLVNRRFNQDVFVLPKSAEVIPIAGKIVGGVAGAIAGTITGNPREGMFFGAHYRLQGAWDDPKVISQPANDGLLRKVWAGITNFPWVDNNKEKIRNE